MSRFTQRNPVATEIKAPMQVTQVGNAGAVRTPMSAANQLTPHVSINNAPNNAFGNVSAVPMDSGLSFFSFTLANTATGARTYVIGDPQGVVAAKVAGLTQPTAASLGAVPAQQASFLAAPVVINLLNYSSTNGASQFTQRFDYVVADISGDVLTKAVPVGMARRNDQFNANLLTLGNMG